MTASSGSRLSIQERFLVDAPCFGCGPGNAKGLRLKSFPSEDGLIHATFRPWPEHDNGAGYLNGGIIATLLDCHSAAAVVLTADQRGLAPDGGLLFVTASIEVRYRRPAPLDEPIDLVAQLVSVDDSEIVVDAELWWHDKVRANARSSWKRWRPRNPQDLPPSQHR